MKIEKHSWILAIIFLLSIYGGFLRMKLLGSAYGLIPNFFIFGPTVLTALLILAKLDKTRWLLLSASHFHVLFYHLYFRITSAGLFNFSYGQNTSTNGLLSLTEMDFSHFDRGIRYIVCSSLFALILLYTKVIRKKIGFQMSTVAEALLLGVLYFLVLFWTSAF